MINKFYIFNYFFCQWRFLYKVFVGLLFSFFFRTWVIYSCVPLLPYYYYYIIYAKYSTGLGLQVISFLVLLNNYMLVSTAIQFYIVTCSFIYYMLITQNEYSIKLDTYNLLNLAIFKLRHLIANSHTIVPTIRKL